jgi:transcriptional regulator GlxA family with amidase domain
VLGCSFDALVRGGRIVTPAGRGTMQAAVERFGLSVLFEDPGALCDPVVARWAEHRVLDVILHGAGAPPMRGAVPGSVRIARLAEEFLRAHLSEPITIRELCVAVGVPERTLHLAFERHVGVSPKAYLKSARLHAVRHELRRAPAHLSVTRIAMQWGFFHPGWFSHDYHRMFGCTPSETRRRAVERLAATG